MVKEFKSSKSTFNTHIGIAVFSLVATVFCAVVLNVVPGMLIGLAILWGIMAFWSKDRVLITLHDDYIEAKEAIAAKKKLIRYKDIEKLELNTSGKILTLFLIGSENKKEKIALHVIEKSEKDEFMTLLNSKI